VNLLENPQRFSHQPDDYQCPICRIVAGIDVPGIGTKHMDVVIRDAMTTAFVASHWWPKNAGHVLVVPNEHYENVYDIPASVLAEVQIMGQRVALALKATYACEGTSFRQHNEPAGNQEVWHYHLHVFPRYVDDDLYVQTRRETTPAEREPFAAKLRLYLTDH
jgi:histidine triad (HIT) family protein